MTKLNASLDLNFKIKYLLSTSHNTANGSATSNEIIQTVKVAVIRQVTNIDLFDHLINKDQQSIWRNNPIDMNKIEIDDVIDVAPVTDI